MPVTELSRIRKPRTQAEQLRDARRLAKIKNDQLRRREQRIAELEMQLGSAEVLQVYAKGQVVDQAAEILCLKDQLKDVRETLTCRTAERDNAQADRLETLSRAVERAEKFAAQRTALTTQLGHTNTLCVVASVIGVLAGAAAAIFALGWPA